MPSEILMLKPASSNGFVLARGKRYTVNDTLQRGTVTATEAARMISLGWAQGDIPNPAQNKDMDENKTTRAPARAPDSFYAPAAIFRIRASGASAATVTVTGITGNTTTTLGTLTVPAGGSATDFYDHGHDAYQWTSTATDTVVEVM